MSCGQARTHFDDPFHDELAREEHVHVVAEHERDERQAVAVERAHLGQAGQARHGDLERHGDEAFDLFRRASRRFGRDLDLDVGHVGKGVHREMLNGSKAEGHERERHDDEDDSLLQAEADDAFHGIRIGSGQRGDAHAIERRVRSG